MRQVPYGLVGNGRLARWFMAYFRQCNLLFVQWRRGEKPFASVASKAKRWLVLIPDHAIAAFIEENRHTKAHFMHCAAAVDLPGVESVHPCVSIGDDPHWAIENAHQVPFVRFDKEGVLSELLPSLKNPCFYVPDRAMYHAWCVLAANGATMLWQYFIEKLQEWQLPRTCAQALLESTTDNLRRDPACALTGPWVREDQETIKAHRQVLSGKAYSCYQVFSEWKT